jgi:hypothetical protein
MKTRALAAAGAVGALGWGWALGSNCARTSVGFVPLNDLGAGVYLGQYQGGLYPNGSNEIPAAHLTEGLGRLALVQTRNVAGAPDAAGKIVLMSIGMSNTTQEWCAASSHTNCDSWSFTGQAMASSAVDHTHLAIVDGAAGGQAAPSWDSPTDSDYNMVRDNVLTPQGLSEAQVQVIWLKEADISPTVSLPAPNADAIVLEQEIGNIIRACKVRYPNLQMVFLSSRIYAGYASSTLNPEPYAYESGFSVKWAVEAQVRQNAGLGVDPVAGDLAYASSPWMAWGPYLWADGTTARSDGLTWVCSDFVSDGTHPDTPGRTKVGTMLLNFFLTSSATAPWFRADHGGTCNPDYNGDGDVGTDRDIEAFFRCLAGQCCPRCAPDFNGDGDVGTDADIESFFSVLAGGPC